MYKSKVLSTATALLAIVSFKTNALEPSFSNFNYNYYEAKLGIGPLTYGFGASASIHPNSYIRGNVDTEFNGDYDGTLALGFNAPLNDWADIIGSIGFRTIKVEDRFDNKAKYGVEVDIGIRQWVGPQLEISGMVGHLSISEENDINGSVGIRFHSTELFSIGVKANFNGTFGNQAIINTRFSFL